MTPPRRRLSERASSGDATGAFVSFALREHDVERHCRRTTVTQAVNESADDVPAPRPLTDAGEALLVDVDDDDLTARRSSRSPAHQRVVDRVLEVDERRRDE